MLTTIALVLGTMRLARRKVLLHDMKSIETLARVDVLCVDKTGTITEPGMNVQEAHAFECAKNDQFDDEALQDLLADYCLAAQDTNETIPNSGGWSIRRRQKSRWTSNRFRPVKNIRRSPLRQGRICSARRSSC